MKTDHLILGAYQTNCYILRQSDTATDCLIVDTGLEAEELIEFLERYKLTPAVLVLTHGHADHIAGVTLLRENFPDIKVCIHKLDSEMLTDQRHNLSALAGIGFSAGPAETLLVEGDIIEAAGIELRVLHTPGHTPGGISLYCGNQQIVFTGDTLFAESVGRTDFPNGSFTQLIESIKEKLLVLPEKTIVYPGHGPSTTIAQEKKQNPYLQ